MVAFYHAPMTRLCKHGHEWYIFEVEKRRCECLSYWYCARYVLLLVLNGPPGWYNCHTTNYYNSDEVNEF